MIIVLYVYTKVNLFFLCCPIFYTIYKKKGGRPKQNLLVRSGKEKVGAKDG